MSLEGSVAEGVAYWPKTGFTPTPRAFDYEDSTNVDKFILF